MIITVNHSESGHKIRITQMMRVDKPPRDRILVSISRGSDVVYANSTETDPKQVRITEEHAKAWLTTYFKTKSVNFDLALKKSKKEKSK